MTPGPIITLLTDFGTEDAYAGVMKGVILGIAPAARIVDLTHSVPPLDVRVAAYHLASAAPYFPRGTIHVAVVDPGVGSERRAIAVQTAQAFFVGPDNGVLSCALARDPARRVVRIENPRFMLPSVSATFHGRDIFAPVAAHLAAGVPLAEFGPEISNLISLPARAPSADASGRIRGCVQHVDRFGNLITDIPASMLPSTACRVTVASTAIEGLCPTYASATAAAPLAVVGSHGFLEIAIRDGNAAQALGASAGDSVLVEPSPEAQMQAPAHPRGQ